MIPTKITDLIPYQTDRLFLLIGSNPLPNYVVARLLLKPGGLLYLVHSTKKDESAIGATSTAQVAGSLQSVLCQTHKIARITPVPVDESNSFDIYSGITRILERIPVNESIGLHYTGGTKAMAIHAYQAVLENHRVQAGRAKPIFSYLDARTMSLRIDNLQQPIPPLLLNPWPIAPLPTFDELFGLHGERAQPPSDKKTDHLSPFASKLANACRDQQVMDALRDWCNKCLRRQDTYNRARGEWHNENQLRSVSLPLPSDVTLKQLFQRELDNLGPLENARIKAGFLTCQALCRWLDGGWLEQYVADCVEQCKTSLGTSSVVHASACNIRIKDGKAGHDFELDVAALSSYRLFGISCTTGSDKIKLKLFEAMIRAQQLGGDEARVALIGNVPNPAKLQAEAKDRWQIGNPIRVYGCTDLPRLSDLLNDWFVKGA